jgi:hypothetical protein
MAVDLAHVTSLLDELGLTYHADDDHVEIGFETDEYKDRLGRKVLRMIVLLEEEGEYFKLFAPMAFVAEGMHVDAFLRACTMVQWRTKLVQFEFDANDGEIRPMIEFPIEDGTLTARQLDRCVQGMVHLLDEYFPALERALVLGEIDEGLRAHAPSSLAQPSALEMLEATLALLEKEEADPQLIAGIKLQIARARAEGPDSDRQRDA